MLSQLEEEQICREYANSHIRALRKKYNHSFYTIKNILVKNGIQLKSRNYINKHFCSPKTTTDQEERDILQLFNENLGQRTIAKQLGLTRDVVKRVLADKGVKYENLNLKIRRYIINEKFFEKIDTQDKAYILGWIYSDGHNNTKAGKLQISLQERDAYILKFIKNSLSYGGNIAIRERLSKNHRRIAVLCISNRKISNDLIKLGVNSNKSRVCSFPSESQVPNYLIHHFMRGFFEGDGWITLNKKLNHLAWGIIGTEDFCTKFQNIINSALLLQPTKLIKTKSWVVRFVKCGTNQVKKIMQFLYRDANMYLIRKFEKSLL